MACTVPGCTSRVNILLKNNRKISFHRFPNDIELKETWIKRVRKGDDWRPLEHTKICSLHFEDSCFREGYSRKILHSYAEPTIFTNLPSSCKPEKYEDAQASTLTAAEDQEKYEVAQASTLTAAEDQEKYEVAQASTLTAAEDQVKYEVAQASTLTAAEDKVHKPVTKYSCMTQTESVEDVSELVKANNLIKRYKAKAEERRRKFKSLQRKCNRLTKKNADLETIIEYLNDEMDSEHIGILKNTNEYDRDNQIVSKYLMKLQGASLPKEYPIEVKNFALTLHDLSPKAYCLVRDTFNAVLPHPKTLSKWDRSVDCKPGLTKKSLVD